ncbi:MAG: hypothetical protein O3C40_37040 [Planctomycetota bacterium]|nr:hypothetical protein [Planctomycetota bacterium]
MGSRIIAAEELRGRALFVYEDLKGPAVFVDRCSFTSVSYGMPHWTHDHLASAALVLTGVIPRRG